jgi:hypothetical protein
MLIRIEITGKTPLMMHNERLADPDDPITKKIKEYTAKGSDQTDDDKRQVSLLEWRGGIYVDNKNEVCMPSANVIKCFREAGKVTKNGAKIARGISPISLTNPLQIDGPRGVDTLIKQDKYFDRRLVRVSGRVKRTRPIFMPWALTVDLEMLEDVLNYSTFTQIVDLAGRATGLCDARILGYGRFSAKLSKPK